MSVVNYKCPYCGANIKIDPLETRVVCDYCGTEFNPSGKQTTEEDRQKIEEEKAQYSIEYLIKCVDRLERVHFSKKLISRLIGRYVIPKKRTDFLLMTEKIRCNYNSFEDSTKLEFQNKFTIIQQTAKDTFYADHEINKAVKRLYSTMFKEKKNKRLLIISGVAVVLIAAAIIIPISVAEYYRVPPAPSPAHTVYIEKSHEDFEGENYQVVYDYFEAKGFLNISLVSLHDLITGWVNKVNTVRNVVIRNNDKFGRKIWYTPDEPVVIKYHSFMIS